MATPVVARITVRTKVSGFSSTRQYTELTSKLHVFHDGTLATVCLDGKPNGRVYKPEDIVSFQLFYSA